jgi:hypothetical protein
MAQYLKRIDIANVGNVEEEAPSHYLKRVNIVEVVDQDGNPWEPVPGPDPWDELVINDKVVNNDGNTALIGDTIAFTTATYIGGNPETTQYRHRFQTRDNANDSWINGSWTNYDNTAISIVYNVTSPGQVRFQCQARDTSDDPVTQVNSFGGVVAVPYSEFGDVSVTINDIEYDYTTAPVLTILVNDPLPVVVTHTGNAAPTYSYEARGDYPLMVGQQAASTVLTFPSAGTATVTCTLRDNNTEEVTTSVIMNFYVVDAFD